MRGRVLECANMREGGDGCEVGVRLEKGVRKENEVKARGWRV